MITAVTACLMAPVTPAHAQAAPAQPAPPMPSAQAAAEASAGLTLEAAVSGALERNPTARIAGQELAAAQARLSQALAARRFQVTFSSSGSIGNVDVIQPPPRHQTFGTLLNTLSIPIPIGDRARLEIRRARAETVAAEARYQSARLDLANQVTTAYYNLLRQQALLQIAEDNRATAQRQLSESEARFKNGDVPELDVLRARVPVASAEAAVSAAQGQVAVARQSLNALLTGELDTATTLAAVSPAAPELPFTLEEARSRALQFAPDLHAAEAVVRADEAALAAARRFRDPSLSLQLSDQRSSDKTGFSREDAIQATVSIPLLDGGVGRAQVREAEATLEGARQQVEVARRTVLTTVSASYLTADAARRQVSAAQVARDAAQTAYDRTVLGYQNGLYSLTDVLTAQSALTQARIAYAQAVYDAAAAVSALRNSVGEGLEMPAPASVPSKNKR